METMKSYVEALDPSVPEMVKIVKKPLEGLQNEKINFLNHVSSFFDVLQVYGAFWEPFSHISARINFNLSFKA